MSASADPALAPRRPALFTLGLRPFFLFGAVWAAAAMALWIPMLAGRMAPPTAFDPISWHAHELLFGYLGAVVSGFVLTAAPNWTGRPALMGWPLAGLVALWLAGRVAVLTSAETAPLPVALIDLALPAALVAYFGNAIIAGGNWRNLPVVALLTGWGVANALFHWEAAEGGFPAAGHGLRLGLMAAVLLISLIGGRITPIFTRNWMRARKAGPEPTLFNRADGAILLFTVAALAVWVVWPHEWATAALAALAGIAHLWRLSRWSGRHAGAEPLVWVLHAGYAFIPIGFLGVAASAFLPGAAAAAQHLWMAGAVGLMTLAVMTRASLGHCGKPLTASRPITALYLALIVSVAARFAYGLAPGADWLLHLAGAGWIIAFGGFAALYWPLLTRAKSTPGQPTQS
ncbi:NnrS family protein [Pikeienuella sp. HZG-20]|uniref:NnrS family protein n=1 Tax=Paludibacillus litoralis TaxID=3133267 RepID=UPI0030ED505C